MNIALILAGGLGTRMGVDTPKQLMLLKNKPVVWYSLQAFNAHESIDAIFVVCAENLIDTFACFTSDFPKLKAVVAGGETRKQSSLKGLLSIEHRYSGDDIVLIHDAARPLISDDIISKNIVAVQKYDACTTVIPVTDTVLHSNTDGKIDAVCDRQFLYQAQTPQSFKLDLILNAHKDCTSEATDDTSLLINQNIPVRYVLGDKRNLKITTIEDMKLAEMYLNP